MEIIIIKPLVNNNINKQIILYVTKRNIENFGYILSVTYKIGKIQMK